MSFKPLYKGLYICWTLKPRDLRELEAQVKPIKKTWILWWSTWASKSCGSLGWLIKTISTVLASYCCYSIVRLLRLHLGQRSLVFTDEAIVWISNTVFACSDATLNQLPLSNCCRTSGHAEQNSHHSQILAVANIQVACAHVNKPRDSNDNIKTCRE